MTDIVRYEPTPIDTERLGDILVKSGFFKDVKDQAQAIVKMLYGGELGFGPIASMMGVYVVEGPTIDVGTAHRRGHPEVGRLHLSRARMDRHQLCRIEFFRA